MLISGIPNPQVNSLLSWVRHANTLVIADRGFPFWPEIETVDLSLVAATPYPPSCRTRIHKLRSQSRI